jgi:tetratricopeptide (TPR) repeat protein
MARAFVHAEKGELQQAFQLLQKAAVAFQAAHMPPHILEVSAAGLQRRDGNPAASLDRLKPIEEAYKKAGATVQWAEVQQEMGRCYLGMKQYTDAVNVLNESLKVRKQAHDRFALIRLYEDLGDAQLGQGDRPGAAGSIARALNIAERLKLQGHMDRLNKKMSEMIIALDGTNTDVPALKEAAVADIDALEALWKAPPQPPQAPEEQKIQ